MFAYKLESKQALKKYYVKIGEKQFKTLYSKSEFGVLVQYVFSRIVRVTKCFSTKNAVSQYH